MHSVCSEHTVQTVWRFKFPLANNFPGHSYVMDVPNNHRTHGFNKICLWKVVQLLVLILLKLLFVRLHNKILWNMMRGPQEYQFLNQGHPQRYSFYRFKKNFFNIIVFLVAYLFLHYFFFCNFSNNYFIVYLVVIVSHFIHNFCKTSENRWCIFCCMESIFVEHTFALFKDKSMS